MVCRKARTSSAVPRAGLYIHGFELARSGGAGGAGFQGAVADISGPVGTALAVSEGHSLFCINMGVPALVGVVYPLCKLKLAGQYPITEP